MIKIFSNDSNETFNIGKLIGENAPDIINILLVGEMGGGKTALAKGICTSLNAYDSFASPTYTIMNHYKGKDNKDIFHMDAYRISDIMELELIGFYEYYNKSIMIIEWADLIEEALDENALWIKIKVDNNDMNKRIMEIEDKNNQFTSLVKLLEENYG